MAKPKTLCPFCVNLELLEPFELSEANRTGRVHCSSCGDHEVTEEALDVVASFDGQRHHLARIAHQVHKLPAGTRITSDAVQQFATRTELPSALEQIDIIVAHVAAAGAGGYALLEPRTVQAMLGAPAKRIYSMWAIQQAAEQGLLHEVNQGNYALTANGWKQHAALARRAEGSRHAFMAMRFGDTQLDDVFSNHLRPAVSDTGYELRTVVGSHKTAGLIDARMRVEIRTSRFLVCDLTHGNRGAYWEAGFAEGLGRPVFYICRRDVLKDRTHADYPHFDTAHQLITEWDPATMADDMEELKAVIRNTLAAEARMADDPHAR